MVDGVNLNMDIVPIGGSPEPVPPVARTYWLTPDHLPLTHCGEDLRAEASCKVPGFQLKRSQLTFVEVDKNGNPVGGDGVVGCFSNCGQYKFSGNMTGGCTSPYRCAGEPPFDCMINPAWQTPAARAICTNWLAFCCAVPAGDPDHIYTTTCNSAMPDDTCKQASVCWDKGGAPSSGVCSCRGFIKNPPCPANICTNPWAATNDLNGPYPFRPGPPASLRQLHRRHFELERMHRRGYVPRGDVQGFELAQRSGDLL